MSCEKLCSSRFEAVGTIRQLIRELLIAFPQALSDERFEVSERSMGKAASRSNEKSYISWDEERNLLHIRLSNALEAPPTHVASLRPMQPPHPIDLKFANAYVRVFNEDLKVAPTLLRHQEIWATLSSSRVPRAIARLTAFSTAPFLEWLSTMEAAASLRYEGMPFRSIALMSKQPEWISGPVGEGYVAFSKPLSFSKAILEEKWIQAISASTEIGLHGLGHSGNIVGIIGIPKDVSATSSEIVLPSELQPIAALVRPGTMAFVCAPNGDLYVVLPSGAVFVKSQGSWHFQNFSSFQSLLSQHIPRAIARHLLRLMLDLSYKRSGALLCIPKDPSCMKELVPDHTLPRRANIDLRKAVTGLKVDRAVQRPLLLAAAAIDGATVLSDSGDVLDVACMVGEPSASALASSGHTQLRRFAGARSTAAWNASIFGLGIKVSEDGPISVFSRGSLIGQLG